MTVSNYYYTDVNTKIIHEVKFFDGFVITRPCSPTMYKAIRKIPHSQFTSEFEEYMGEIEPVVSFLKEITPEEETALIESEGSCD